MRRRIRPTWLDEALEEERRSFPDRAAERDKLRGRMGESADYVSLKGDFWRGAVTLASDVSIPDSKQPSGQGLSDAQNAAGSGTWKDSNREAKEKLKGLDVTPRPTAPDQPTLNRCRHHPKGHPLRCPVPSCPNTPRGVYRVKVMGPEGRSRVATMRRVKEEVVRESSTRGADGNQMSVKEIRWRWAPA